MKDEKIEELMDDLDPRHNEVKLQELAAHFKTKYNWKNVRFHYEDKPKEYLYVEGVPNG